MDPVMIMMLAVVLLTAVGGLIWAIRNPRAMSGGHDGAMLERLADQEKILKGAIIETREGLERRIQELADRQTQGQLNFLEKVLKSLEESSTKLREGLDTSAAQSRKELTESLRGFQEQLERQAKATTEALSKLQGEVVEKLTAATTRQLELAKEGRDAIGADQEKARKELSESLRTFQEQLERQSKATTEALSKLQGEVVEKLSAATAQQLQLATEGRDAISAAQEKAREELTRNLKELRDQSAQGAELQKLALATLNEQVAKQFETAREVQHDNDRKQRETLTTELERLRKENEAQLEKMRQTVDEKLQSTLDQRLGESFKQVSERLEQVHKGLGEMQSLATGVGDLKKVLTNVRARGSFGETQLHTLLEQVLSPPQFRSNVRIKDNTTEQVEFAVILPGKGDDDSEVLLPIDSKFPMEDYARLQEAYDRGDRDAIQLSARQLGQRVIQEAKTIKAKYVSPPKTTDFAILFLPTEGLFSEVMRLPDVVEAIQRENIVITGPTTLYALLNSLNMGFRTLAVQKRSSEVWNILSAVKTEFGKFGDLLDKAHKSMEAAQNHLDTLRTTRSKAIQRKLKSLDVINSGDAERILGLDNAADNFDDEDEVESEEQPAPKKRR